ncbi:MAG: DUF3144 domain-containing protein [Halioglobus sp.]
MSKTDAEIHNGCVQRFIDLANAMKNEGTDVNIVSGGLMSASALYASFLVAGNDGGLTASGVDKVSAVYKRELERIQRVKREQNAT